MDDKLYDDTDDDDITSELYSDTAVYRLWREKGCGSQLMTGRVIISSMHHRNCINYKDNKIIPPQMSKQNSEITLTNYVNDICSRLLW